MVDQKGADQHDPQPMKNSKRKVIISVGSPLSRLGPARAAKSRSAKKIAQRARA